MAGRRFFFVALAPPPSKGRLRFANKNENPKKRRTSRRKRGSEIKFECVDRKSIKIKCDDGDKSRSALYGRRRSFTEFFFFGSSLTKTNRNETQPKGVVSLPSFTGFQSDSGTRTWTPISKSKKEKEVVVASGNQRSKRSKKKEQEWRRGTTTETRFF